MTSISDTIIIQAKKRDLDAKAALLEMEKYGQQLMHPDDGLANPFLDLFKKIFSSRTSKKALKTLQAFYEEWHRKNALAVSRILYRRNGEEPILKEFEDDRSKKIAKIALKQFYTNDDRLQKYISAYKNLLKYRALRNDLYKLAIEFKTLGY